MPVFFRLLQANDKAESLRQHAAASAGTDQGGRFVVEEPSSFLALPTSTFVYWVGANLRAMFDSESSLAHSNALCRQGLATADDFRFVRLNWELSSGAMHWPTFSKGGPKTPYYNDIYEIVNWKHNAEEIRSNLNASGAVRSNIWMLAGTERACFGRPGISWSRRPHSKGKFVALPEGQVFSDNSPSLFGGSIPELTALAVTNSIPFLGFLQLLMPRGTDGSGQTLKYEVGYVKEVPLPELSPAASELLSECASKSWKLYRSLDTVNEISHAFVLPSLVGRRCEDLRSSISSRRDAVVQVAREIDALQAQIDISCFEAYQVSDDDRSALAASVEVASNKSPARHDLAHVDTRSAARELVSWCVGVGLGRFDVRLATGEREWPGEPDPFDPLPICSAGMLTGDDGLSLELPPAGYPVEASPVLVDDPGHELNIATRVRSVFDEVFGAQADEWWSDVGEALSAKSREVGSWLSNDFFDHHLKTYSKSRRKAPIYWPMGTASGSYLVWLYSHRVTGDSLFRVLNDVVSPKLVLERRRLSELTQEVGPNPSARERKAIASQENLVDELQQFVDELTAVAPLWHPDLNDGIVVVLAPLWRLFAHHKPWSKELRNRWDSLMAGEYDWAQLAMRLWPERVVQKCAEDRSLAIAHELEDVFWSQDEEKPDKWHPRQSPTVAIDKLIADRTDPATKAALEDAVR